jgi:Na+/proline symporter
MDDLGSTAGVVLITLIAYKLGLISIGVLASRFTHDETDFFLGGRKMGPWVAGLSYAASTSSAWVLLGYTGFVYDQGVSALWMVPGILGAYAVIWLFFGPRLRAASAQDKLITASDYMAAGAGRWKVWVRSLAGLLVLFTFVVYIAAQFGAAAIAFESQFNISHWEGVLMGAWVILIYALMGGFWAVSLTDTLQAGVMAVISVVLPLLALISAGGIDGVWTTLSATMPAAYLDPYGRAWSVRLYRLCDRARLNRAGRAGPAASAGASDGGA